MRQRTETRPEQLGILDTIAIVENGIPESSRIATALKYRLSAAGYKVLTNEVEGADLIVCIGGDGSFLRALNRFGFPETPFAGINTGHLGFFQELDEGDIGLLIEKYGNGDYVRQTYRTVDGVVEHAGGVTEIRGLNEIVVRNAASRLCHLDIYIGDSFIENFSGDGIVVSTPAGSTAYNYALGGSLVDPRLSLLQVTPIAAVNNSAYRSFTSGILLPPDLNVEIYASGEDSETSAAPGARLGAGGDSGGVRSSRLGAGGDSGGARGSRLGAGGDPGSAGESRMGSESGSRLGSGGGAGGTGRSRLGAGGDPGSAGESQMGAGGDPGDAGESRLGSGSRLDSGGGSASGFGLDSRDSGQHRSATASSGRQNRSVKASPAGQEILVAVDGNEIGVEGVRRIGVGLGEKTVTLLRFRDYSFWKTVKQKLL